ncbi:spectinomycin phosphotransferase [Dictyobacter alpinus]|uniref:Spectinomycin phosphotransferase n=1 Tax=Dictyobacter alpinus TaxID=2014873 RepID=A0A402BGT2_9CHLR|nr:aminoglycoside phosphotransferase family protein [Dictyobacter alpinus]GCE30442.1 spectinomycin phosphotransferase [Dictyobacter alpinus]
MSVHEELSISEEYLRSCLQEQYGLTSTSFEFIPLGLDSQAGIYRVMCTDGLPRLLKVRSGLLYEASCLIPRYLHDQGIASVVAPLPTLQHSLWTHFGDWTVCLYPFVDGDTSWDGMTTEHWRELGAVFKQVHQVTLPFYCLKSLRKETFDPTQYARQIHDFESHYLEEHRNDGAAAQALCSSWLTHRATIHSALSALEKLALMLQKQAGPYVLCHADLHPANLLRDQAGHVFVIDWDVVMLAPKERDFIFVSELPAPDPMPQTSTPFFQGYGQTEIDWTALTYYRWERIVQDIIACAQDVLLRDDLGEETKADAVRLFDMILAGKHDIQLAHATASHIRPF